MLPSKIAPLAVFQMSFEAAPAGHEPVPVTIPLMVVTQEVLAMVDPAVPLILRLFPAPITKFTSPVAAEPRVRLCSLEVWIKPLPSRDKALAPVPEIEAVGVHELTLIKANLALPVAWDPSSKSWVSIFGVRTPFS